jgi:hypothetical protein
MGTGYDSFVVKGVDPVVELLPNGARSRQTTSIPGRSPSHAVTVAASLIFSESACQVSRQSVSGV